MNQSTWKILLKLYLPACFILLYVSLACYFKDIPISLMMVDPLAIYQGHPWLGIISNIGNLIWCACIAVCFFTAAVLANENHKKEIIYFIILGGSITLMLMLDDFFMLHELIYTLYLHAHQNVTFSIYAVIIFLYLLRFRTLILKSEFMILVFAFIFFALSTGADILSDYHMLPWHRLYEDGFKFLGIVSWAGYFINFCFREILLKLNKNREKKNKDRD